MPNLPTAWQPLLDQVRDLHARCLRPAEPPLPHPWEEIGPGYCYGPAFGHWDIVHQLLDTVEDDPEHTRRQLLNNFANQRPDGFLPGSIWMHAHNQPPKARWPAITAVASHPPLWPAAVDAYVNQVGNHSFLSTALPVARRQIAWFVAARSTPDGGFYYTDILNRNWESGVDEGIRFDDCPQAALTCVDATSHVHVLVAHAAAWARTLGRPDPELDRLAERLRRRVHDDLWSPETGFFHDAWSVRDPRYRRLCIEGFFPLVAGIADADQATRLIDGHLLNPERFFTAHPVPSVAVSEPTFSLRMWRGPTWNSMTYWIALGCLRYGRQDAAKAILGRALDQAARVFAQTGAVWEFYHPLGGDPRECTRKPDTPFNQPCRDYLGHAPFLAMARCWQRCA